MSTSWALFSPDYCVRAVGHELAVLARLGQWGEGGAKALASPYHHAKPATEERDAGHVNKGSELTRGGDSKAHERELPQHPRLPALPQL